MVKTRLKEINIKCYYEGNVSVEKLRHLVTDLLKKVEGLEPKETNIVDLDVDIEDNPVVMAEDVTKR